MCDDTIEGSKLGPSLLFINAEMLLGESSLFDYPFFKGLVKGDDPIAKLDFALISFPNENPVPYMVCPFLSDIFPPLKPKPKPYDFEVA